MNELNKRIFHLSPQKRELLELLLKDKDPAMNLIKPSPVEERGTAASQAAETPKDPLTPSSPEGDVIELRLSFSPASSMEEVKQRTRQFYNSVSRQLNATIYGKNSYFLNFGYVADSSPQYSTIKLPDHYLNKNSVKLVLELIGTCDLSGKKVLDIGCGRGGTVHVINKFYEPQAIVGVDLSPQAIVFCKEAHKHPRISFCEGDAENLMFEDESFDVITNVESSHSYPDITAFYMQVSRLLKPGGYFLYTDLFPVSRVSGYMDFLRALDLMIEVDRDITKNVLLSCDETASLHLNSFHQDNSSYLVNNFLGVPGSQVYHEMKTGRSTYRIYRLRRNHPFRIIT